MRTTRTAQVPMEVMDYTCNRCKQVSTFEAPFPIQSMVAVDVPTQTTHVLDLCTQCIIAVVQMLETP